MNIFTRIIWRITLMAALVNVFIQADDVLQTRQSSLYAGL